MAGRSAWKALKRFGKKATGQPIKGCCISEVLDDITDKWTGGGGGGLPPSGKLGGVLRGDGNGVFEEVDANGGIGYTKGSIVHKIDEKYLPEGKVVVIDATGVVSPSGTISYSGEEIKNVIQNGKVPMIADGANQYLYSQTVVKSGVNYLKFVSEPYLNDDGELYRSVRTIAVTSSKTLNCPPDEKMVETDAPFVVHFHDNAGVGYISDETMADIYKAYTDGKRVYGEVGEVDNLYLLTLGDVYKTSAGVYNIEFEGVVGSNLRKVKSLTTGAWNVYNYDLAGGGEELIVTITPQAGDIWTCDQTNTQIYNALNEGKKIVCKVVGDGGVYYQYLRCCETGNVYFEGSYKESAKEYKLKLTVNGNGTAKADLAANDEDGFGYIDRQNDIHKIDKKFIPFPSYKYDIDNNVYYIDGEVGAKADFGAQLFEDLERASVRLTLVSSVWDNELYLNPTNFGSANCLFEATDIHFDTAEGQYIIRKMFFEAKPDGTIDYISVI